MPRSHNSVSLDDALAVVSAGRRYAEAQDVAMSIVVLDDAGRTVVAIRMDGSTLMSVPVAENKAYTAVGMGAPTNVWADLSAKDSGFGGAITSIDRFTPFVGGIPLHVDGELIGAVGASGGTLDQDDAVAKAAAAAINEN